ncbi:MAG: hypothetical protein ISS16_09890, partial [Ignavibacteria bacterium]|nr:hypothetical protein [Ignavibacteria bacterium]
FANIFEWDIKYGMRNVSKSSNQSETELFISNYLTIYPIEKQEELFEHEFVLRDSFNDEVDKL